MFTHEDQLTLLRVCIANVNYKIYIDKLLLSTYKYMSAILFLRFHLFIETNVGCIEMQFMSFVNLPLLDFRF